MSDSHQNDSPLMEVNIETLTGSSMILQVSPLDTVFDVKTYIQKLEGIPASQQHLVWQSNELVDEKSLKDCHLHSGATLRLVLNMRGGPINTRRVPVEERTVVEYFTEASHSDVVSSSASSRHRPVTVVVCQSGDQLKFYQLLPTSDLSPQLSSSHSLSAEDVEPDKDLTTLAKERREENRRTRDKMKSVRSQMERCSLLKDKKDKLSHTKPVLPAAPSVNQPVRVSTFKHFSSSSDSKKSALIDLNTRPSRLPQELRADCLATLPCDSVSSRLSAGQQFETYDVKASDIPGLSVSDDSLPREANMTHAAAAAAADDDDKHVAEPDISCVPGNLSAGDDKELGVKRADGVIKTTELCSVEPLSSSDEFTQTNDEPASGPGNLAADDKVATPSEISQMNDAHPASVSSPPCGEHQKPTVVKRRRTRNEHGSNIMVRSLDSRQSRVVSGLLTSLVHGTTSRLPSGGCYQLVRTGKTSSSSCTTKSRQPSYSKPSAAVKCVAAEAGSPHCISNQLPSHLPPVVAPKTCTKRCVVCNKKTSLATNFQCRCGGNFCGVHRYAEAHNCTVDYRTEGRRALEHSNPMITADKLPRI